MYLSYFSRPYYNNMKMFMFHVTFVQLLLRISFLWVSTTHKNHLRSITYNYRLWRLTLWLSSGTIIQCFFDNDTHIVFARCVNVIMIDCSRFILNRLPVVISNLCVCGKRAACFQGKNSWDYRSQIFSPWKWHMAITVFCDDKCQLAVYEW